MTDTRDELRAELVVRLTELAVMELDADEENTLQITAWGDAAEKEIRAFLASLPADGKLVEELEAEKAGLHRKLDDLSRDYAALQDEMRPLIDKANYYDSRDLTWGTTGKHHDGFTVGISLGTCRRVRQALNNGGDNVS